LKEFFKHPGQLVANALEGLLIHSGLARIERNAGAASSLGFWEFHLSPGGEGGCRTSFLGRLFTKCSCPQMTTTAIGLPHGRHQERQRRPNSKEQAASGRQESSVQSVCQANVWRKYLWENA
jgi:hypothetical protein